MRYVKIISIVLILVLQWPFDTYAGPKEDIGYTELFDKMGESTPDGSGVPVAHVEAPLSGGEWMPDPGDSEFQGKTFLDRSGYGDAYSGHATVVGRIFYGNTTSPAPGINLIECFDANHWMGTFLGVGSTAQPFMSSSRIINHSWVANSPTYASEILRRLDWVVETDEFLHVVGNCTVANPLLGAAFNVIATGRTLGESGLGTGGIDDDYTAGRPAPHIVTPYETLSAATPMVSSIVAALMEMGHNQTYLATDPQLTYRTNRSGERIYNTETPEVIKAALMAGADRFTKNTTAWEISDYRIDAANQTVNGLDKRYGAGQLNVNSSYFILADGEQNSAEDVPAANGEIGWQGFDYDPYFGGASGSNDVASYYVTADDTHSRLSVSLVWNIKIDGGVSFNFDGAATLYDMDVFLYDITSPQNPVLKASSASDGINHEHIWTALESGKTYCIRVQKGNSQTDFLWDYALAWQLSDDGDRDSIPDYWELSRQLDPDNPTDANEDSDLDGLVNSAEYIYNTNPQNADTDNDGFGDGSEVSSGYDPLDPDSHPAYERAPTLGKMSFIVMFGILFVFAFLFIKFVRIK